MLPFLNLLYFRAPFFLPCFLSRLPYTRCTDTPSPASQSFASTVARRARLRLHAKYSPASLSLRPLRFTSYPAHRTLLLPLLRPLFSASRASTAQCATSTCLPSHVLAPSSRLATCASIYARAKLIARFALEMNACAYASETISASSSSQVSIDHATCTLYD